MRSALFLLLVCLVIAGTATAAAVTGTQKSIYYKEAESVPCTADSYAGLPGGSVIAVVELSGHGDTYIDGILEEPSGTEPFRGNNTKWYATSPGTHKIFITSPGYTNYFATMPVCSGKVTYVYYDQEAHLYAGTTRTAAATTTTAVPVTTASAALSQDPGAIKGALGTTNPSGSSGSLSVTTEPAGAAVFIDGIQQGISPATIPGLSAGTHTLLLKKDGYQDLSLPVVISAGKTQYYSSALLASGTAGTPITKKSSAPGIAAVLTAVVAVALLLIRKTNP